jgi:hypothetical protein
MALDDISHCSTSFAPEPTENATAPRSFGWYVGLTQLPGMPVRLRGACREQIHQALRALPVASRREHLWGGVRAGVEDATLADLEEAPAMDAAL